MKGYFIRSTNVTPSVYFNPAKQILDIRGKSTPENPLEFYKHLHLSLDKYIVSDFSEITVNIAFEYFNTSSSKCLFMLFKRLDKIYQLGRNVTVNWYYELEDEDMCESGEDFASFYNIRFNLIEIPKIKALGLEKTTTERVTV